MGQAVSSISVTHSKWYIRRAHFVLEAQPLDVTPLSCSWLLNNLPSQKLWCPVSLSEPSNNSLSCKSLLFLVGSFSPLSQRCYQFCPESKVITKWLQGECLEQRQIWNGGRNAKLLLFLFKSCAQVRSQCFSAKVIWMLLTFTLSLSWSLCDFMTVWL
jgi:hypothetical protein